MVDVDALATLYDGVLQYLVDQEFDVLAIRRERGICGEPAMWSVRVQWGVDGNGRQVTGCAESFLTAASRAVEFAQKDYGALRARRARKACGSAMAPEEIALNGTNHGQPQGPARRG